MKPQPINTAPKGQPILGWHANSESWLVGNIDCYGQFYSFPMASAYTVTHWLPYPEPPAPKQAYVFLEEGDLIDLGDEWIDSRSTRWQAVSHDHIDSRYEDFAGSTTIVRRPIPNPES